MRTLIMSAATLVLSGGMALSDMIRVESPYSVSETVDRLEAAVKGAGANVFARVDHQKGASGVGVEMPASTVLFFGSPKIGAPIMNDGITIGLDLPLRALAFDEAGQTVIVYHDPKDVAVLHGIATDHPVLAKMTGALKKLTAAAVAQ